MDLFLVICIIVNNSVIGGVVVAFGGDDWIQESIYVAAFSFDDIISFLVVGVTVAVSFVVGVVADATSAGTAISF